MASTRPRNLIKEDIRGSVANPTTNISGSSVSTCSFGRTEASAIEGTLVTAAQTNVTSVGTIGTGIWNSTFGSTANTIISGSANAANISGSLGSNASLIRTLTAASISGSYEGGGSTKISGSSTSTGSFGRIDGSLFSGSFIGKGTFNNIDDPTAMAIALG